jgi:AraC family transcriptional regulator
MVKPVLLDEKNPNYMEAKITTIASKIFIGECRMMSFANMNTYELWSSFMPRRKAIKHNIGSELYSAEVYPSGFFNAFDPTAPFEKWAAVEVSNTEIIPEGMKVLHSPEGLYAVFLFKGTTADAPAFYNAIFTQWLPANAYKLDARPHFAVMGTKYKNNDPESEEEIWIPITK